MAELNQTGRHPVISVIIATYNRAHLIARAIESVLFQSFSDFELIVIDDGSTDGTAEVVSRYKDPRIIYCRLEHGERSRARNGGIELSKGKYIAFLDSDDWYLPNKLADQVASLETNPDNGIALGGWLIVDDSGRRIQEVRPWEEFSPQPSSREWLIGNTATPITIMIKREWLERVGGFNESLSGPEDTELWIRLGLAGCRVVWTTSIVAVELVHQSNSLRNWSTVTRERLKMLDILFSNQKFINTMDKSKQEICASFHLVFAWKAYDAGLFEEGKAELLKTIELNPRLCEDQGDAILYSLIGYANYFLVTDPIRAVNLAFDHLPERLTFLYRRRKEVLGKTWMSRAWRKHAVGDFNAMRESVFHAIWLRPSCITDRGILSILFQSIVGHHVWGLARQCLRLVRE